MSSLVIEKAEIGTPRHRDAVSSPTLLAAENLSRSFVYRRGSLLRREARFRAVDDVSLTLREGETLGIVGESGCGKSTLGRLLSGLARPDAGSATFADLSLSSLSGQAWRASRRDIQVIFQDTAGSLDPRLPIEEQVREPLDLHAIGTPESRVQAAQEMLDAVRLGRHMWGSVPGELSGGQQQRVVIARALILKPRLLVCDEPVAALDVSIQAQIISILQDMRSRLGLSMIFISHDLGIVRHIADHVAIMYLGQIVESGPSETVFSDPAHPYTRALISAVPVPDPKRRRQRRLLSGDPPSPHTPPPGCRFHTRCPLKVERCTSEEPRLTLQGAHGVACHFAEVAP
ncbi:ABC transporter ATP-binding protein [Chelativorans sp. YIM 93263]|uniref:ABC transporter ATP-binding protein n=1 Tax=Chelativorans sp. YIM 93263 TaxID=2906648 RepID=UPI002378372A|nr:oligopeptide/dipeptide ABC transporter ATP-binding protein [Chelativorans sp. YIM 93263]